MKALLSSLFLVSVLSACGLGARDNFTAGRTLDRCEQTFTFCGFQAGCVMGTGRYLQGSFPGSQAFIISAPAESFIDVQLYFDTQQAVGTETQVLVYEPGCFDTYEYNSNGLDIFRQAGNDRVLDVTQQIFLDGDHLVLVRSDAIADYAVVADVRSPKE